MTDKAEVETIDGITWQKFYDSYDGHLYLDEAYGYDQWGNLVREYDYRYDSEVQQSYLYKAEEWGYTGPLPPKNHYNYRSFEQAYRTYHLRCEGWDGKMEVYDAEKTEIIREKDRVIRRTLERDYNFEETPTLSNWEQCLKTRSEEIYYLNADGTRPVKQETYYREYEDELRLENVQYYEWDDLGRLTRKYSNFSNDASQHWEDRYTYADNNVLPLTLDDIILRRPSLYPVENYENELGGRPTSSVSREGEYSEEGVIEYENGKLAKVTWKELRDGQEEAHGTMYYSYNVAGHLAYYIDEVHEDGEVEFIKMEYVYDDRGTWIGLVEYDGESIDGPWVEWESYFPYERYDRAPVHRLSPRRHKAPNVTDMSDGRHYIDENDGVWATQGVYVVVDGKITDGHIEQRLINNASRPTNPETYYTDPIAPLMGEEDLWASELPSWMYIWKNGEWTLLSAPSTAYRYYQAGEGVVRCDTYNREQQITSSTIYYKDANDRLIRVVEDGVTINEYTYLPDSNYIDTHNHYGSLRKYYYSLHNYVDPNGINTLLPSTSSPLPCKRLDNGRIVIVKDAATYTTAGQRIK